MKFHSETYNTRLSRSAPCFVFRPILALALALGLCGLPAYAQTTYYWAGAGTGFSAGSNWTGASNWSTAASGAPLTTWVSGSHANFSAGTSAVASYPITLNANTSVGNMTFQDGNTTISGTATLTLAGSSGSSTIDVFSSRTGTISAVIGGTANLNKTGFGTLYNTGSLANSHTGGVNVFSGIYEIAKTSNVSSIGNSSAVSISAPGTLRFNGTGGYTAETIGTLAGAGTLAHIGANPFTLTVGSTTAATSTTFSGTITNGAAALNLVKSGAHTLTLSGDNDYTGTTTVSANGGTLIAANDNALGSSAGGTSVASNGTLALQGGITITGEALTLDGNGAGSNGALRNLSGANTYTGNVTLAGFAKIQTAADALSLSGNINSVNHALTIDGAGDTTVSGVMSGNVNASLTKTGTGTLVLDGAASNTRTGTTTVSGGTVVLDKSGGTTALGTGNITVNSTGTLQLDQGEQIANTTDMTVNSGGTFFVNGQTETLDVLTLAGGVLDLGASGNLSLTSLNITANSTLDFGTGSSLLNVTNFSVSSGVLLTILNWNETFDYFIAQNWPGATYDTTATAPMTRVRFVGGSPAWTVNDTRWQSWDQQITPVPEPSTYGAIFLGASAVFAFWHRQRRRA